MNQYSCVCVFQGKTVVQAEIDAAAELIDFFRFNAKHAIELEKQQPVDGEGCTNTSVYRGLEVRRPQLSCSCCSVLHLHTSSCVLRVLLLLWHLLTSLLLVEIWQEHQL